MRKSPLIMILLAIALTAVVVFALVVSRLPSEFTLTRSITVAAPPETVFAEVNDLRQWNAWSPWAKLDPDAKNAFEGPASGVGASMSWVGNDKVGEGKMTITESLPGSRINFRLEFVKPFKATNTAEFTFRAEGDKTAVSWTMRGQSSFFFKAMGVVMNCSKMCSDQFDKGLASLKAIVEAKK